MAYSKSYRKKTKFTKAENIAFRLGQERRVKEAIKSGNKDSRVYDAYCKGLKGTAKNKKKPLYGY